MTCRRRGSAKRGGIGPAASGRMIAELHTRLIAAVRKLSAKSELAGAIRYTLSRWEARCVTVMTAAPSSPTTLQRGRCASSLSDRGPPAMESRRKFKPRALLPDLKAEASSAVPGYYPHLRTALGRPPGRSTHTEGNPLPACQLLRVPSSSLRG